MKGCDVDNGWPDRKWTKMGLKSVQTCADHFTLRSPSSQLKPHSKRNEWLPMQISIELWHPVEAPQKGDKNGNHKCFTVFSLFFPVFPHKHYTYDNNPGMPNLAHCYHNIHFFHPRFFITRDLPGAFSLFFSIAGFSALLHLLRLYPGNGRAEVQHP